MRKSAFLFGAVAFQHTNEARIEMAKLSCIYEFASCDDSLAIVCPQLYGFKFTTERQVEIALTLAASCEVLLVAPFISKNLPEYAERLINLKKSQIQEELEGDFLLPRPLNQLVFLQDSEWLAPIDLWEAEELFATKWSYNLSKFND